MIPVFEPIITEGDRRAVDEALMMGEISGTYGRALEQFEEEFAAYCGSKYGVATSSGTAALHLAVASLDLEKGSEVLISASTNIATALAVVHNGLIPVPVDSEPETWNLDLDLIEGLITPKTKAIIPVHLFGHPVDMDRLVVIARKHNLIIIEDAAEAHGAHCRYKKAGSFGELGCFSFYANKVITTGEGGMVITNSKERYDKLRLLRNLAFTKPRFVHEELGFNFRLSNYQAALGLSQLHRIERIIAHKRRVARLYTNFLCNVEDLQLPVQKDYAFNIYWMYAVVVEPDFGVSRDKLMERLAQDEIDTRTMFCPMNLQPCLDWAMSFPKLRKISCPVAENLWHNGLYLPSSYNLDEETIHRICTSIDIISREGLT